MLLKARVFCYNHVQGESDCLNDKKTGCKCVRMLPFTQAKARAVWHDRPTA